MSPSCQSVIHYWANHVFEPRYGFKTNDILARFPLSNIKNKLLHEWLFLVTFIFVLRLMSHFEFHRLFQANRAITALTKLLLQLDATVLKRFVEYGLNNMTKIQFSAIRCQSIYLMHFHLIYASNSFSCFDRWNIPSWIFTHEKFPDHKYLHPSIASCKSFKKTVSIYPITVGNKFPLRNQMKCFSTFHFTQHRLLPFNTLLLLIFSHKFFHVVYVTPFNSFAFSNQILTQGTLREQPWFVFFSIFPVSSRWVRLQQATQLSLVLFVSFT